MEIEHLKSALEQMKDPRRTGRGHILHKLEDIIIGLCTLLCNGEDFTDMEEFGKQREEWLRTFLELPHGIPDSGTFRRVFERLDPKALSECLYDWLGRHWKPGTVVAIDGKTICGSKSKQHKAYHVVSAFATENQLVLGELAGQRHLSFRKMQQEKRVTARKLVFSGDRNTITRLSVTMDISKQAQQEVSV